MAIPSTISPQPTKVLRKKMANILTALPTAVRGQKIDYHSYFDCRLTGTIEGLNARLLIFRGDGGVDEHDSDETIALYVFLWGLSFKSFVQQRVYNYILQHENRAKLAQATEAELSEEMLTHSKRKLAEYKMGMGEIPKFLNSDEINGPELWDWLGDGDARGHLGADIAALISDWLPSPITLSPIDTEGVALDCVMPGWIGKDPATSVQELGEMKLNVADYRHVFRGHGARGADDAVEQCRDLLELAKIDKGVTSCDLQPIGLSKMAGPAQIRLGPYDPQKPVIILRCKPKPGMGAFTFNLRFQPPEKVPEVYATLRELISPADETESQDEMSGSASPGDQLVSQPPATSVMEQIKEALEIVAVYKTENDAIVKKRLERDAIIAANTSEEASDREEIKSLQQKLEACRDRLMKNQRSHEHKLRTAEAEIAELEKQLDNCDEYTNAVKLLDNVRGLLQPRT